MSPVSLYGVSLVAQTVKNLPAVQEAWLWSLGREDSLKKGMATHSSVLAWRIPWTEEAGRLESMGLQRIGHYWVTHIFTFSVSLKEAIVKQITSPGGMHESSARAWCTGKTQRDWVEREVGGGSGWGIHVTPWLIHVNVWQKPLQYCKVINIQLININEKKIK